VSRADDIPCLLTQPGNVVVGQAAGQQGASDNDVHLAAVDCAAPRYLRGEPVVVLGLPRGGVPVAFQVAKALGAPLDVIVVRKLGVPFQPELGMGAVGEDEVVLDLNRRAQAELRRENDLAMVPGATHLFEEPGALEAAAALARDWFIGHFPQGPALNG
jgi:hypothetical protein